MTTGIRSFLGATLPRAQQFIILVLGLFLVGLWAWRAGHIWPAHPPPTSSQQKVFIEINGDLPRPGLHVFASAPTIQDVWEVAGGQGTVPKARQSLSSGTKIIVTPEQTVTLTRMSRSALLTLGLALDLNLASAEDLEAIPGIGPILAKRIVEFREEHGPFQDIGALLNIRGMAAGKLEKIRPYLELPRTPDDREDEEE